MIRVRAHFRPIRSRRAELVRVHAAEISDAGEEDVMPLVASANHWVRRAKREVKKRVVKLD